MWEDHRSSQSILGEGGQATERCDLKSDYWMTQFHTLLGFFVSSFRAHVWRWSRSRREILTTAGRWWRRGRSVSCAPSGRWWERWFGWFCRDPSRQRECRSDCCCTGTPSTPGPGSTQHTVTHDVCMKICFPWMMTSLTPLVFSLVFSWECRKLSCELLFFVAFFFFTFYSRQEWNHQLRSLSTVQI